MSANSEGPEVTVSSWWQQKNWGNRAIDAFKTGLPAVLCVWLGNLFGLSHSYWAAVSAIVVMGSDTTLTFASCRDRIIGTAIGALLGWMTFYAWHGHYLLYGLSVTLCLFVCGILAFDKAGRLAAVALTIIVLIKIDGGPAQAAVARFLEVGLGIVVALAVTLLVFPPDSGNKEIKASA
ncbi:MAG: FUSC family protein [Candidatus Korobacteraceae bacterium]